eukprot:SAG11_NODE_5217_length_1627_cov_1.409031_3_plen_54_part_00
MCADCRQLKLGVAGGDRVLHAYVSALIDLKTGEEAEDDIFRERCVPPGLEHLL